MGIVYSFACGMELWLKDQCEGKCEGEIAISYQLSAISYQLSAISRQLSAFSLRTECG